MVLKESFLTLLRKKQLSTITVKEICELADINRSTFYAHYADQYDLLTQIEDEIIEDMNTYLTTYRFEHEAEAIKMTEKLLEYFASKLDECKTLLSEHSESSFQQKVMKVTQRFILKNWINMYELDEAVSEYLSSFIVSGGIQAIKMWMYNDMDKSPKEMAELINKFVHKGLSNM